MHLQSRARLDQSEQLYKDKDKVKEHHHYPISHQQLHKQGVLLVRLLLNKDKDLAQHKAQHKHKQVVLLRLPVMASNQPTTRTLHPHVIAVQHMSQDCHPSVHD
jgi:hypothetical protein